MFRRDYIQRMIEEFGKMIGHVMGLRAMNQEELALEELRAGYKTYFGLDAQIIHEYEPEKLIDILLSKEELKNPHLDAIARAIMTEGELLQEISPLQANDLRKKALLLFLHLEKSDHETFSITRKNAIEELGSILENPS
ncbi:hypothetical protein BH09BAC5_BH09BAC5_11830 [soil metagenome]